MGVIYEPSGAAREYSPLACNLYTGCQHGCVYCYAPACLRMRAEDFWAGGTPKKQILHRIEQEAPKYSGGDRVLFCFTCDPYQPGDNAITRDALRICVDNGVRFQVLTKGGTRAARDIDLFKEGDAVFATTLIFDNDALRQQWEPGAADCNDRAAMVCRAHRAGIPTWVSIEPVIDPDEALAVMRRLDAAVDEWRIGKLNHHPHAATVDWNAFGERVADFLGKTDTPYMIKDALQPFMPKGFPAVRRA